MGLEAVMICIDNSEWSRNGDYTPSRFDSQTETANLLGGTKTGQNPETGVGLLTMAGERVEVLLTPTSDLGSFIAALANMQIKGKSDICRGIQCATLALKHRQNKNQKQKIICFVGSPIDESVTEKQMEQLGKQLKKNNVSLDIVSFGEVEGNKARLEKLINACNSNDTSHLVEVETGAKLLSDVVLTSPICFGEGGAPPAGAAGGNFEFGVDPSTDPELALALRISMEEERRRMEAQNNEQGGAAGGAAAASSTGGAGGQSSTAGGGATAPGAPAAGPGSSGGVPAGVADIEGFDDMDEELRQALLLSMQDSGGGPVTEEPDAKKQKTEPKEDKAAEAAQQFDNPDFLQSLMADLPGVDVNDAKIQEVIGGKKDDSASSKDPKKDGDKKDGDKKDGDKK